MSLLKTSTLNGFGMAIKLLFALLANKVVAVMLGPNGMAVYGQFQSLMTLINGLAAAPAQAGVIRLTAANQHDMPQVHHYWSAALRAVLISSVFFVGLGVVFAPFLAEHLLKQTDLTLPLMVFFLTLPAASLLTLFLSCANGVSEIKNYVIIGIIIALATNIAVIVGVFASGMQGILIAVGLGQLLAVLLVLSYLRSQSWFFVGSFLGTVSPGALRQIFSLATMAFAAVMVAPLIQIAVRHLMTAMFGLTVVGYWQAVSRFGDMYVMAVTALLGVYYFPRFSAISHIAALRKEILSFLCIVYPVFLLGYAIIVLCKDFMITLMYSPAFLPAAELMPLQMLSDATRILSWLTGYLVMARSSPTLFVTVEIGVGILWVGLADLFMKNYGYVGALYASTLANFIYTGIFVVCLVKSRQV